MPNIEALIDLATGQPRDGTPLGLLLSAQAQATPERLALSLGDTHLSFAAMDKLANRRARHLVLQGLRKGDRVILAMPNRFEYLECAFALWKIGATPCPVSHRLAPAEFSEILALSQARMVIGSPHLPVPLGQLYDIDQVLPAGLDESPLDAAVAEPGKIANSGGSTGRPKLIVDPVPSVWGPDKEGCRRGPRLTLLNPGPLYHSAPFNTTTMAMAQGTHIICLERFDPEQWCAAVERFQVDYAYMVPTMMARIARWTDPRAQGADLSSIETLLHMAAPCPADIKRWWIDRIGASHVWEVYGGTERIGSTTIDGDDWLNHPGSVGKPRPGHDIVILGEDGTALPPNEVGDIYFRKAATVGTGYAYIGSDSRARQDLDSFGDMGWVDEDGYLYIADRRTDMVLVGGVNIYPAEIEAIIEGQPKVVVCAVIGLPDEDMGNRLHAIVEYASPHDFPASEQALLDALDGQLNPLKRPRSAEFTCEPIRDEAGKVRRSALRAERIAATI